MDPADMEDVEEVEEEETGEDNSKGMTFDYFMHFSPPHFLWTRGWPVVGFADTKIGK